MTLITTAQYLCSFSKLLEKIVAKQLVRFLHINDIIYKHQYGFRAKHNTSHPVLHFSDQIYNSLNQNPSAKTLAIFIDLKKAFDTVDHNILLKKLEHYGVRNSSNNWFHNYLVDRNSLFQSMALHQKLLKLCVVCHKAQSLDQFYFCCI